MKLPASIGQKKTKAIEQVLEELSIGWHFIFMAGWKKGSGNFVLSVWRDDDDDDEKRSHLF